jgi:pimeloyl-ACP methyl ester carboxylesterase
MPPQSQARSADAAPQAAPYTSRFVDVGALKLHYLDYGTAGRPPILCVHGSAANGHWYDFVAPGLSRDYHVLAIDLRGHGDSGPADPPSYSYEDYASDINKAVEALDLRDFVLIGHSMGGAISLLYSSTYPGRVGKLVIVDTSMKLSNERISEMRDVGSRPSRQYHSKDEIVSRYKLRPGHSFASPDVVRHIASNSVREADDGTWTYKFDRNVYATRVSVDNMPFWDKIKIPTLLIRGGNSPRITPEVYAAVKARAPQVEMAEVSPSEHHVTLDNPTGFVDAVKPFLEK